jgi:class 3 adenylate cyclase
MTGEVELPPYRAVLVVDTKGFGGHSDRGQAVLAQEIPGVLALAFEHAGLAHVWRDALFPHGTGDGFGLGFATRHLPAVVMRLFDTLQDVLAERDARSAGSGHARMRMRASLNVGPVLAPGGGSAAAVGGTVITTHRLLDAPEVRDLLTRSDPGQTFLAVALSERVYEDVVLTEYAPLPPSLLIARQVAVKEYSGIVRLYVPRPSGDLLRHGLGSDSGPAPKAAPPSRLPAATNVIKGGEFGTAIQVGHLHGGFHQSPGGVD